MKKECSHIGNSELPLCGANNVNNQLIFNGTNGNLNNNNRFNSNRVRVALESLRIEAKPDSCISSAEWWRHYLTARKHKRNKAAHLHFRLHCLDNLARLKREVATGEYIPNKSKCFVITKPRVREIIAADFADRVVQTCMVESIKPKLERTLHPHSYACRVGKGSLVAVKHLQEVIFGATQGYTRDAWVYKTDFKSFFMSIDTELWVNRLAEWMDANFTGERCEILKYIARVTYQSLPQLHCDVVCNPVMMQLVPDRKKQYGKASFYGIPIGNVTSQTLVQFAVTDFLNMMDSIAYGCAHYTDDNAGAVLDKEQFLRLHPLIAADVEKRFHYTIHPEKFYFQHYSKGIEFLGFRIKYDRILPSKRLMHNFRWKITMAIQRVKLSHRYMLGTKETFMSTINSCCGLLKHTASYNYRKRELSRLMASPWAEVYNFDTKNYLKVTLKNGYNKADYYRHKAKIIKKQTFKTITL